MDTLFPALIEFQLALLDAYESLLAQNRWDEARLNEALKSWLAVLLPALRAQCALGEQMLTVHRELIRQYRGHLEAASRTQGDRAL
jgi:hypothetical protein